MKILWKNNVDAFFFNSFCNFNILYMVILCIVILMSLILERNLDSKECSLFQLK